MNQDNINSAMDHLSSLLNYMPSNQTGNTGAGSPLVYHTSLATAFDYNRVVFGAPGTGKSFKLKQDCSRLMAGGGLYERVTFHPDYTYGQFVGSYKPVTDDCGEIRYDFVPGPFMRVLVAALKSARSGNAKPYLLLIEEMNRAKVAAVFGDVFQLLDRDDRGASEYEIHTSEEIKKHLARELGGAADQYGVLRVPNNMYIWASMNSADQGVYPMDTAFKRRWSFEYLGINENDHLVRGTVTLGQGTSAREIEWNQFRKALNEKLAVEYHINEDKLLGPFFLAKKFIESDNAGRIIHQDRFIHAFKSKVLMYLYEDAAKQFRGRLFAGCDSSRYSSICDAFDSMGVEIFGADFDEWYQRVGA